MSDVEPQTESVTDEQPEAQIDEGIPQTLVGISFPDIFRAQ